MTTSISSKAQKIMDGQTDKVSYRAVQFTYYYIAKRGNIKKTQENHETFKNKVCVFKAWLSVRQPKQCKDYMLQWKF